MRSILKSHLAKLGILFGLCLCTTGPLLAADDAMEEAKDLVLVGDAVCTRCHEETEAGPSLLIGKTRHGVKADPNAPTCTSCHGESRLHVDNPDGSEIRPLPDLYDRRDKTTPVAERNAVCLDCHQGGQMIHWQGSVHDRRDVACSSCHTMHAQHDPAMQRAQVADMCITCHKEKRAQINKISRHPVLEGKVVCTDCHGPHGSAGRALMKRDTVTETCYQCHTEKRGPFLWNHQPVTEDCSICHNPHGSSVTNLLKWRPPFLCQQCHEPSSHRGQLAGFGTAGFISQFRVTAGRGCLNCHTNIHGGNNPISGGNGRSRAFIR